MKFKIIALIKKYEELELEAKEKHFLKKANIYKQIINDLNYANEPVAKSKSVPGTEE